MIDFKNITEGLEVSINILGEVWIIHFTSDEEKYPLLEDCNGYCDASIRTIIVRFLWDDITIKEPIWLVKKNIRHEIFHAFFDESGLAFDSVKCTNWAVNEEMVDWLAIQYPKINKLFKELGVEE